ncbi:MAG: hypothetical protein D6769_01230 [Methanobacteriota archaeon]|nr:MAG: hypothetical protein D6769_01230 [Euryarchaeota archaeon]
MELYVSNPYQDGSYAITAHKPPNHKSRPINVSLAKLPNGLNVLNVDGNYYICGRCTSFKEVLENHNAEDLARQLSKFKGIKVDHKGIPVYYEKEGRQKTFQDYMRSIASGLVEVSVEEQKAWEKPLKPAFYRYSLRSYSKKAFLNSMFPSKQKGKKTNLYYLIGFYVHEKRNDYGLPYNEADLLYTDKNGKGGIIHLSFEELQKLRKLSVNKYGKDINEITYRQLVDIVVTVVKTKSPNALKEVNLRGPSAQLTEEIINKLNSTAANKTEGKETPGLN